MAADRPTYDTAEAARARDQAIDQVEAGASEEWKRAATEAVIFVCQMRLEFTTDAIWALLDKRRITPPREPRAMGAIMRQAVRDGVCMTTDRTSKSVRVDCHRRPLQVWRSRCFKDPP